MIFLYFIKLIVSATDNGNPAKTATVPVDVRVLRNFQAPVWNTVLLNARILDIQQLGVALPNINLPSRVTDGDSNALAKTVNFQMDPSTSATAKEFFAVSATGDVTVIKDLHADAGTIYNVRFSSNF